ncbi:MAG: UbiD family decarboxylase, partial [Bacteroidales bacterium]|nr:UbiD family decarboxylase [Bacteroidales bacterium]
MFNSLKDYTKFLEERGELRRIREFVDPVLEIACATDIESKKPGGGKALLFENTGTAFPVLTNMMGSEARIRYALGVDNLDDIGAKIDELVGSVLGSGPSFRDKLRLLPKLNRAASWIPREHKGHAPCQDVVQYSAQLSQLPILKCWPQDGGRFITLPLVNTASPVTGVR